MTFMPRFRPVYVVVVVVELRASEDAGDDVAEFARRTEPEL